MPKHLLYTLEKSETETSASDEFRHQASCCTWCQLSCTPWRTHGPLHHARDRDAAQKPPLEKTNAVGLEFQARGSTSKATPNHATLKRAEQQPSTCSLPDKIATPSASLDVATPAIGHVGTQGTVESNRTAIPENRARLSSAAPSAPLTTGNAGAHTHARSPAPKSKTGRSQ